MIEVYAVAALVCAASWVAGSAVFALAGGRDSGLGGWLAPAVGLSLLMAAAVVGARIGEGAGAAVAVGAVVVASAAAVLLRRPSVGFAPYQGENHTRTVALSIGVVVAALFAASLPFLIAGHSGVLGVGLVNDDMASHLQIAEHVREPFADPPRFADGGYPIGPHAVVAALAEGLGLSIVDAFAALTIALAPLLALTLVAALGHLSPLRRGLAALVAALSYLSVAYLAQGAFKEPLEAIILIAFALYVAELVGAGTGKATVGGERPPLWRAAPAGLLAAASVLNYSLPGLVWIAAVAAAILILRYYVIGPRPQRLAIAWRRFLPYALGALAIIVVATISEWGRVADFTRLDAFRPDRIGSDLGNLKQSISPAEALGIWPTGDFRTTASAAGPPTLIFWLGGAFALAVAIAGTVAAFNTRRFALVGALAATAAIWVAAELISTPYFAAKALAIGAPIAIAISLAWALTPGSRLRALLAAVLIAGAAISSFLALRSAPVGPEAHAAELGRIRPEVEGAKILFLGRDDFIGWELRRAEVDGVVKNHFNVGRVPARYRNPNGAGDKFDIDAVTPKGLRTYDYVLAPRGEPRSDPNRAGLELVERTPSYELFAIDDPGTWRTLDEGASPGARCDGRLGARKRNAKAYAFVGENAIVRADGGESIATDRHPATFTVERFDQGSYDVSIAYDSRRPLLITAPGLRETVPANLDFRGPTPLLPVGTIRNVGEGATITFSITPDEPNAFGRLLSGPNEAHVRAIGVARHSPRLKAPMRICKRRDVDYYVP